MLCIRIQFYLIKIALRYVLCIDVVRCRDREYVRGIITQVYVFVPDYFLLMWLGVVFENMYEG